MRKFRKALVLCLILAMAVSATVLPAFAFTYTAVSGGTTTFYKDLVMESNANVPNATFNFTIAPGTAVSGSAGTAPVSAGIGSPTITSSVTFSPSDSTSAGTPSNASASGSKYVRKTLTVDFSGVDFPAPGIYRYVVTESGTNTGVTNDSNLTRWLDVYVTDNESDNTLVVSRYVWRLPNSSTKPTDFLNTYTTHDLTLSKTVTGNQASREKYFKFVVTISNATAGTVYTVDRSNADTKVTANASTASGYNNKSNPATLTANSSGTISGTFYLQSGQSIKIQGLTAGTKYAIVETAEDYSPSYKINSGSATSSASCPATAISADTTVAYTNSRAGTVPTGVMLSMIPGMILTATGAAAFLFAGAKRKERED